MTYLQEDEVVGRKSPKNDLALFMGQLMQARAILGFAFNFVSVRVELHCKEPILKIRNKYSQKNRSWEYMYINRSQTHAFGNWN